MVCCYYSLKNYWYPLVSFRPQSHYSFLLSSFSTFFLWNGGMIQNHGIFSMSIYYFCIYTALFLKISEPLPILPEKQNLHGLARGFKKSETVNRQRQSPLMFTGMPKFVFSQENTLNQGFKYKQLFWENAGNNTMKVRKGDKEGCLINPATTGGDLSYISLRKFQEPVQNIHFQITAL